MGHRVKQQDRFLKVEKFGDSIGFGAALLIFISILYYLLSRTGLIPSYFDYLSVMITTISAYVFTLIFYGVLKKWKH